MNANEAATVRRLVEKVERAGQLRLGGGLRADDWRELADVARDCRELTEKSTEEILHETLVQFFQERGWVNCVTVRIETLLREAVNSFELGYVTVVADDKEADHVS